jgi:hypothetical protein
MTDAEMLRAFAEKIDRFWSPLAIDMEHNANLAKALRAGADALLAPPRERVRGEEHETDLGGTSLTADAAVSAVQEGQLPHDETITQHGFRSLNDVTFTCGQCHRERRQTSVHLDSETGLWCKKCLAKKAGSGTPAPPTHSVSTVQERSAKDASLLESMQSDEDWSPHRGE